MSDSRDKTHRLTVATGGAKRDTFAKITANVSTTIEREFTDPFKFTRVEYLLRLTGVDHALRSCETQHMRGIVIGKQHRLPGDDKAALNPFVEKCLVVDRQG